MHFTFLAKTAIKDFPKLAPVTFEKSLIIHLLLQLQMYFISPFVAVMSRSLVVSYYKGRQSKSRRCKYNDACAFRTPDKLVQSI